MAVSISLPTHTDASVHRSTLANGLTVVLAPVTHGHVVHLTVFLQVGSSFETQHNNGISHFVEHLLFQGNAKFPDSAALCAFVEERGGEVNAQTTPDFTQVYLTLHRDYLAEGLQALAALVFAAAVDRWDVERERQIILHEHATGNGDPDAEIRKWLWPDHPLGFEVSGSPANVERFTPAELAAHYRAYFRPANAVLVVAGNFDAAGFAGEVDAAFGAPTDAGPSAPTAPPPAAAEPAPQRKVLDALGGTCGIALATPACSLLSDDVGPLQAANFLLGGGLSSRLFLRVRESAGLAYEVGSSLSHFRENGYFLAHAACRREQVVPCAERLLREVRAFAEDGVTEDEMGRMRRFMHCQMDYRTDDPAELAAWYGLLELLERPDTLESPRAEAERMARLTREEVNDVLRRWIRTDHATVVCHTDGGWWHKRTVRKALSAGMNWAG